MHASGPHGDFETAIDQQQRHPVEPHQQLEGRPAHADCADRRTNGVALLFQRSSNEAHETARHVENNLADLLVRIVDETIQQDLRERRQNLDPSRPRTAASRSWPCRSVPVGSGRPHSRRQASGPIFRAGPPRRSQWPWPRRILAPCASAWGDATASHTSAKPKSSSEIRIRGMLGFLPAKRSHDASACSRPPRTRCTGFPSNRQVSKAQRAPLLKASYHVGLGGLRFANRRYTSSTARSRLVKSVNGRRWSRMSSAGRRWEENSMRNSLSLRVATLALPLSIWATSLSPAHADTVEECRRSMPSAPEIARVGKARRTPAMA